MFFLAISVANDNNLELFFYHVMAQKHAQEVMLRSGMSTILTTSNKSYSKLGISQGKYMGMSLGLGQLLWVCVSWFGQKKKNDNLSISTNYYFYIVIEGHKNDTVLGEKKLS